MATSPSIEYAEINLSVSNAVPGQDVTLTLAPMDQQVAWSSGPALGDNGGFSMAADGSDSMPLAAFAMSGVMLRLFFSATSDVSVAFTVHAFVAAAVGVRTFELRNESEPGIQVVASLDTQQPVVITSAGTILQWPG